MNSRSFRLAVVLGTLLLGLSVTLNSTASGDTNKGAAPTFEQLANQTSTAQESAIVDGGSKTTVHTFGNKSPVALRGEGSTSVLTSRTIASAISVAGSADDIVVNEGELKRTYDCRGQRVIVNGGDNTLTLRGECSALIVSGSGNKVTVEAVGTITTKGDENQVTWTKGLGGQNPKISNPGKGNVIKQAKR